jgi:hypothetical protein
VTLCTVILSQRRRILVLEGPGFLACGSE